MNSGNCLGETSIDDFLDQYWQKKPLLIRNAFPEIKSPITADELAGLACESQVNSRLVIGEDNKSDKMWQVEFGPFDENRFSTLPESDWSLLVSDVERHFPETKSILNSFRFIPDWRIDDLMISYAPAGGSVGAHSDAYDVFLLQLNGQRLWKISEHFDEETINDIDLPILKEFDAEQEWLLNAGDMLYLPPNVAHHGIAQACLNQQGETEHCMTASIGFRAPSLNSVTSDYIHYLNENKHDEIRYSDITPAAPVHHAEITEDTVSHFIEFIQQGMSTNRQHVKRWLGQYCSDNKTFEELNNDQSDIDFKRLSDIASQQNLMHSPYSNFLFSHSDKISLLFVNGVDYEVSKQFAESLCDDEHINFPQLEKTLTSTDKKILVTLFNSGAIITE